MPLSYQQSDLVPAPSTKPPRGRSSDRPSYGTLKPALKRIKRDFPKHLASEHDAFIPRSRSRSLRDHTRYRSPTPPRPRPQSHPSPYPKPANSGYITTLIVLLILSLSLNTYLFASSDPLDPAARQRIRREWFEERKAHEGALTEAAERMERARVGWAGEYARHEEAVERMETRMGAIRTGWAGEVKTHEAKRREMRREMADIRMGWEGEVREHEVRRREMETEMSDIRAGWVVESREHDKLRERMLEEREQWEADRRERERREAEEKRRKEEQERAEEEKKRAGLLWENLRGGEHCLRYGTREYTAKLGNVPTGYDALHGCRETPVSIHGVKLSTPNFCDDKGDCGGVWGHWFVDFDESSCATYWEEFKDKGCTAEGSGIRRVESHLENLQPGVNWHEMCATTPANFYGRHFASPTTCVDWGKHGIWGIWEIGDNTCY